MISISDLRFRYPEGEFELQVPALKVETGETVAIATILTMVKKMDQSGDTDVGSKEKKTKETESKKG